MQITALPRKYAFPAFIKSMHYNSTMATHFLLLPASPELGYSCAVFSFKGCMVCWSNSDLPSLGVTRHKLFVGGSKLQYSWWHLLCRKVFALVSGFISFFFQSGSPVAVVQNQLFTCNLLPLKQASFNQQAFEFLNIFEDNIESCF